MQLAPSTRRLDDCRSSLRCSFHATLLVGRRHLNIDLSIGYDRKTALDARNLRLLLRVAELRFRECRRLNYAARMLLFGDTRETRFTKAAVRVPSTISGYGCPLSSRNAARRFVDRGDVASGRFGQVFARVQRRRLALGDDGGGALGSEPLCALAAERSLHLLDREIGARHFDEAAIRGVRGVGGESFNARKRNLRRRLLRDER